MSFSFQHVTWHEKRSELKRVREKVFVYEYHIPKNIEFDHSDKECNHLLVLDEQGNSIATARINKKGVISRVAVLKPFRTHEFYIEIFEQIFNYASSLGVNEISFNCRLSEKEKFTRCGYSEKGHVFMEAGIARQRLSCPLSHFDPSPFTLVH
jgi:predicted GNAT family N-acyltransferase